MTDSTAPATRQIVAAPGRLPPDSEGGIRNVQVGCGPLHLREDWWNTDLRPFRGLDEVMDAAAPWPFGPVLDHVYAEHFLEHLDLEQSVAFLTHAGASLRKGGRLRLSTPGLEWVMRTHFSYAKDNSRAIRDTFGTNRAFHGWGHKFLYSKPMLRWLLEGMGFADVTFHDYGESEVPIFQGIERHGKWYVVDGHPSVWIVEAMRGDAPIAVTEPMQDMMRREFLNQYRGGH
jgi:hypothetical protein